MRSGRPDVDLCDAGPAEASGESRPSATTGTLRLRGTERTAEQLARLRLLGDKGFSPKLSEPFERISNCSVEKWKTLVPPKSRGILGRLESAANLLGFRTRTKRPFFAPDNIPDLPAVDADAEAVIRSRPSNYAIVRILGNDLPPRHKAGQTLDNLKFIVENEPEFRNCQKLWLLNRIRDEQAETRIIEFLDRNGQEYIRLPFDLEQFAQAPLDFTMMPSPQFIHRPEYETLIESEKGRALAAIYRWKNVYAMNNNGARNAALEWGKSRAKWVLPWDGACFLTTADWGKLTSDIAANEGKRYHVVPMARLGSNSAAFSEIDVKDALEEPQIVFRCDAGERFDETFPYGRRPKVELLVRLGVPGPWSTKRLDPWDIPSAGVVPDSHLVGEAGMVRRLSSGRNDLEDVAAQSRKARGAARSLAIVNLLREIDKMVLERHGFDPKRLTFFCQDAIEHLRQNREGRLSRRLREAADDVIGHSCDAPSGRPRRHGDIDEESGTNSIAKLSDRIVAPALAWSVFGETKYRDCANQLAESLVSRSGTLDHDQGFLSPHQTVQTLDALRLIGDRSENVMGRLQGYLDRLVESPPGKRKRNDLGHDGVLYDLQVGSLAAFVGDLEPLLDGYLSSASRLDGHFGPDGEHLIASGQSSDQERSASDVLDWQMLVGLYRACGFPVEHQPEFNRIELATDRLIERRDQQAAEHRAPRSGGGRMSLVALHGASLGFKVPVSKFDREISASPHDEAGIPQFWPLVLRPEFLEHEEQRVPEGQI